MEALERFMSSINDVVWSTPLVVLCLGAGIFLSIRLRFPQFRHLGSMAQLTVSKETSDSGITPFQAFSATVGSRVGMGNIAGVATAIFMGGPGAVFWMWIIALLGGASAFVESTLGQAYKTRITGSGEYVGGPAYFIEKGLKFKPLAIAFALAAIIGPGITMPGLHTNSIASAFRHAFGITDTVSATGLTVVLGLVVCGGAKRIGKVAELLSPFMCVVYVVLTLVVVVYRIGDLPGVFGMIFSSAFGMHEAFAGIVGSMIAWGVKRGVYSNEAGQGSGAIVCAVAETSHPAKQGLVQIFSIYIDTLVICTCSAIIILLSGFYNIRGAGGEMIVNGAGDAPYGILYVQNGLNRVIPGTWSGQVLAVSIVLFVFTSLMGYYYQAESNVNYLTRGNAKTIWGFRALFLASVFSGVLIRGEVLWSMGDLGAGLMAWFNIVAILLLSNKAAAILTDYEAQQKLGLNPCFDPKDLGIEDTAGAWDKYAAEKRSQASKQL